MVRRVTGSGGISLAYDDSGDPAAQPMVLLHGMGARAAAWQPVIPAFAAHFRVIGLDLRGHGDSDWPGAYSFQLMCDDVVAVLDGLDLAEVILAGHSLGGALALMVAMRHPQRVARLIVEDATPGYPRYREIPDRPPGPLDFDWAVLEAIIPETNAGGPGGWEDLPGITAPTLLIGGGPQSTLRQDKLAETAARIPHCDLVTIPAGHYVHANRPAEFADAVLAWLRSSAAQRPAGA